MRALVPGPLLAVLISGGCVQRDAAPSDAELIAQLNANPADFKNAVRDMTADPIIDRIEAADPSKSAGVREARLQRFMADHGVEVIEARPDGQLVSFTMFTGGLAVSGQMKSLTYSTVTPEGEVVADTDAETARDDKRWRVAVRPIGVGWHIQNSCC